MTVEAVVFDIGNVLIEWEPHRLYDAEIGVERRKRLFAEVDLDGMNLDVDRGAPFRERVFALAEDHPEWGDEVRMWHDRWIEMASPEIPHSVRLLRALRAKGVPVFALSNFGIDTFELASTVYPFLTEFDQSYISGHLRTIKPEPEIYRLLEEGCGITPGALLFADDRSDNIAMAESRGWQGHLFTDPEGWAARLVESGLLTESEAG